MVISYTDLSLLRSNLILMGFSKKIQSIADENERMISAKMKKEQLTVSVSELQAKSTRIPLLCRYYSEQNTTILTLFLSV